MITTLIIWAISAHICGEVCPEKSTSKNIGLLMFLSLFPPTALILAIRFLITGEYKFSLSPFLGVLKELWRKK